MALIDEVTARIPTQRLINLTNPNDSDATSISNTPLINAIADMGAEFEVLSGTPFDDTDDKHISIGITGVVIHLQKWIQTFTEEVQTAYSLWRDMIEKYRITHGTAKRMLPKTNSQLSPTNPDVTSDGRSKAPMFDSGVFEEMVPNKPASARDDDRGT